MEKRPIEEFTTENTARSTVESLAENATESTVAGATESSEKESKPFFTWKRALQIGIAFVGTIVLLSIVLKNVDWMSFIHAIQSIQMKYVVAAFLCFFLSMCAMSVKFYMIFDDDGFWTVFKALMSSNFFYILPGGAVIGTGSIIAMLKRNDNIYRVSSVVIFDNVTKFFSLIFCCMLGTLVNSVPLRGWVYFLVWSLLFLMILLIFGLMFNRSRNALLTLGHRLDRFKWGKPVSKLLDDLASVAVDMTHRPGRFILHIALGIFAEMCLVFPYMVLSHPLGIDIPLGNWFWINGLVRIAASVPLSVGGLGAREGVLTLLLGWLGVVSGASLTLSLTYSVLNIFSSLSSSFFLLGGRGRIKETDLSADLNDMPF